jgi:hypothetical protein
MAYIIAEPCIGSDKPRRPLFSLPQYCRAQHRSRRELKRSGEQLKCREKSSTART